MTIIVTGASGLLGTPLVAALRGAGERVVTLVRREPRGGDEAFWQPAEGVLDPAVLAGARAVVHLAGAPIAGRRWSAAYKSELVRSRVEGTRLLVGALGRLSQRPEVLVSASGIDFYGDTGDRVIDESAGKGSGFLPDLCERWEAEARAAGELGMRTAQLRTGLVLSGRDGALGKMLPIFRIGLGAPLGTGRQYWSWISDQDWLAATLRILDTPGLSGPVNLTSPTPVTNAEFTRELGAALRRPTMPVPVPGFALTLGVGDFAKELLSGHRILPAKLTDSGFVFTHTSLGEALRAVL
ncbi:TIGR01777 family oxidoreductase [Nonomuraea glycinis]|uniref:Epimerase n=1 Tax=Nonomuraea glycinis TaxID=2047744 RepID=A0A918AE77_9ACTN|nr:TIGR01777 family oxidoreductase [Nonomuraea glycinis]MCA2181680.1 TIGR01777 family oxidoreductase [Nonomuraea glycinis]GGP14934.1 epimerase [Nonomuraea glycinis]